MSLPNEVYPLRKYTHIICTTLESTSGSFPTYLKVPYGTSTGSEVSSLYVKVNITGSTYYIGPLWAPP